MDSKYLHLIALIVAVFFSGVYLRGEFARKREIKRELAFIKERQSIINDLVDQINTVTAQKDSLIARRIAAARLVISALEQADATVRDSIAVLDDSIRATNSRLEQLAQEINNVPGFFFEPPNLHSVHVDPDASLLADQSFEDIPVAVGLAALDQPAIAIAPKVPAHLQKAIAFGEQGIMEDPLGSNRSPDIDEWLALTGLRPFVNDEGDLVGHPYCAAFVAFCLEKAGDVKMPEVRTARARDYIQPRGFIADMLNPEVEARIAQRGVAPIPQGSLVIWKLNKNPQDTRGHIGFVIDWEGQKGHTVEANTSPPGGNQREGLGVFFKERRLEPFNFFRITDFTFVTLEEDV